MSEPVVYDGDDTDSSISDDEQPVRRRAVQNQQEEEENIQVSNVSLKRGKVKPEAQLYEAPAGKSHESEDDAGDEDGQEEEEHDEEDGEEAGEGEGEEGEWEGEKKEEVKKELDPWDVPTTGKFWLHDDRFDPANRGRGGRYKRRGRGGRGGKQLWEAEEPMWTHDKFEELEKEPEPIDDRNGRGRYSRGRGRGRRGRRYRGRGRGGRGYGRRGRGRGRGRWVKKDSVQNEKVQPSTLQHNAASFYPSGAGQGNQLPADPSVPNGSNHGVHAVPKFSQQEVKLKKSSETKHQPSRSQGKMNPKAKGFVPNMKSGDIQQQTAPHQIVPQSDGRFYDGSAQPVIDTAQPILQTGQQVLQTSEMPPAMPALLTGPNGEQQLVYGYQTPQGFVHIQPPQVEQTGQSQFTQSVPSQQQQQFSQPVPPQQQQQYAQPPQQQQFTQPPQQQFTQQPQQQQFAQNVQYVYEVPGYGYYSSPGPVDPGMIHQASQQMAQIQMGVPQQHQPSNVHVAGIPPQGGIPGS
mmetsp:Transcript_13455/g.27233  ORF Transcript_13455/g.27233 Transcript_13455/m.27233 type:complete len:518 (-) Transcript_13455:165-1718(-)